jgi:hypothetical protein
MENLVTVSGQQIYNAAIEGSKRKYNRSKSDLNYYANSIKNEYEALINSLDDIKLQKRIRKNTKNDWRKALMQLTFLTYHHHIAGEPSETHVRVMLGETLCIFDIPLNKWKSLIAISN